MKNKIFFICSAIIFCITFAIFLNIKVWGRSSNDVIRESFSKSEKEINKHIEENNDIEELTVTIGEEIIEREDFENEEKLLSAYTDEEKEALGKDTEVIEAIKSSIILQEAEKNDINPEMDIQSFEKVAEAMYENSDKNMTKEQYVEKWINIQSENEIKSLYMAETLKKLLREEIHCTDENVEYRMTEYKKNKTPENIRLLYNAYIEYLASNYNICVEKNGEKVYSNTIEIKE